jgi:hypothetical protein
LNKAKGEKAMVVNAAANTNRIPLVLGFKYLTAVRAFQSKVLDRRAE